MDIAICVNQYKNDVLYVETKRAGKQLIDSDVEQLLNYLNIINVDWGILTNGKDYLLLNNKIDGEYKYKIVFNFNLKDGSTDYILKFFTYEYIFDRKVTNYFKYLAQFKAYKKITNEKDMSWRQYHSTLFNFFMYLAQKDYFYGIDKIRHHDFKEYLILTIDSKKKQNKRYPKSKTSISNYYRYISGMYETFKLNGMEINNPFEKITEEEMLSGIEYDEEERFISPLNDDEIEKILKAFEFTRNPERNRLIFLLILYCAMDKSEVQKLKVSDIDFKNKKLIFDDREIPLPKYIIQLINEYLVIKEKNGEDSDYLFCRYYNKAYDFILSL